jgi:membrane-associated phospholipid phosphatase
MTMTQSSNQMIHLHFSQPIIQFLADHREAWLTKFFLTASFLGDVTGFIIIVTLIYTVVDKTLGVRLSVVLLLTMSLNHLLKIVIKNPRPFIRDGTYLHEWAVSRGAALELATEYSTPSGHAMAGAAFYSYLYAWTESRLVKMGAVALIAITGLSRPYLGVHYLEDIVIGWSIGLLVGTAGISSAARIERWWARFAYRRRIAIAVGLSFALWLVTVAMNGWRIDGQPRAFLGYAGFLTGIVIGRPLELAMVDFDPLSFGVLAKAARYLFTVVLVIAVVEVLGALAGRIAPDFSTANYLCQYLRYTVAGFINIFLAPYVFTAIGLADSVRNSSSCIVLLQNSHL